MVPDLKENEFLFRLGGLENQSQAKPGPALKKIGAQLSDPRALTGVGKSPCWQNGQEGLIHRLPFFRGKLADLAKTSFRQLNPPGDFRGFR